MNLRYKLVEVPRKGKNKLAVQAVNELGKKKNIQLYELNERRKARIYINNLKEENPNKVMPEKVSFKMAFKEYAKAIEKDQMKVMETRLHIIGYINRHIKPYISKELLSDYTYHDFKEGYIPQLLKSKCTQVKNLPGGATTVIRTNKTIGKKVIKDAVYNFKLFVRYCLDREWWIDDKILSFKFNKNFFQGENTKDKWMPEYKDVVKLVKSETDPLNRALFQTAAETGCRLNELLGICYNDVNLETKKISLNHSVDKWNGFRENFLKTDSSKRAVEISTELAKILGYWMEKQVKPRRAMGYKLLFGTVSKKMARRKVHQAAKKLKIKWIGGISPFRKFSSSAVMDKRVLTDKQFMERYGWTNLKTFRKYYQRDLDTNKKDRKAVYNNLLTT